MQPHTAAYDGPPALSGPASSTLGIPPSSILFAGGHEHVRICMFSSVLVFFPHIRGDKSTLKYEKPDRPPSCINKKCPWSWDFPHGGHTQAPGCGVAAPHAVWHKALDQNIRLPWVSLQLTAMPCLSLSTAAGWTPHTSRESGQQVAGPGCTGALANLAQGALLIKCEGASLPPSSLAHWLSCCGCARDTEPTGVLCPLASPPLSRAWGSVHGAE